jgi:hypothetical protein
LRYAFEENPHLYAIFCLENMSPKIFFEKCAEKRLRTSALIILCSIQSTTLIVGGLEYKKLAVKIKLPPCQKIILKIFVKQLKQILFMI